MAININIHA